MKILFAASEVVPFAKTGGLADVIGALPQALVGLGHEVRIIMPRYRAVDPVRFHLKTALKRLTVSVGATQLEGKVLEATMPGADIRAYFIDQPGLFDREGLYHDGGEEFPDNLERFSFFSQAVLQALPELGWQPDILHCHDWHTGLVCAHMALTHAQHPFWAHVATVMTVHNLAYQGLFARKAWPLTNLPERAFGSGLGLDGTINCLKGGLVCADVLSTVSPTYAREIQQPEFGCHLDSTGLCSSASSTHDERLAVTSLCALEGLGCICCVL